MFIKTAVILATFLLLSVKPAYSEEDSLQKVINLQVRKFQYILENAVHLHKDTIDIIKSSNAAFLSLLNSFDRFSEYYPKEVITKLSERNKGVTVGIGIDVFPVNDTLTVVNVAHNSPASDAGLKIGDQVLFIDDIASHKMNRSEVLNRLAGDTATKVNLIIRDFDNGNIKSIVIIRRLYESYSVNPPIFLDSNIVYFAINRFSELTAQEFKDYIKSKVKTKPKCVILDLRGNTGGYLGQAVELADQFLSDSVLICETVSNSPKFREKFYAKEKGFYENTPLIILTDSISASGSEVLAAAIQDNDRGLIIGTQTYGKATAQKLFNMIDSTAFKLTVAEYRTPLGRRLQRVSDSSIVTFDESASLMLDTNSKKNIDVIMKKYGGINKVEIYKTKKGRSLFSTWGIMPDIIVSKDTNTPLTNILRSRGIFLEWAIEFYQKNKDYYKEEFSTFDKFKLLFNLDELKMEQFKGYCIAKKLWNNEMYQIDKSKIAVNLKAVLAFIIFGPNESNEIMLENDVFIKTALKNLDKAELIFKN